MSLTRAKTLLVYALKTRSIFVFIAILLGIALLLKYLLQLTVLDSLTQIWTTDIDPLISLATLIIAMSVWAGEVVQDWKSSIPNKLTVVFTYHDKEVMRCNRADLTSEADIRALGQQIGLQIAGPNVKRLDFRAPRIQPRGGDVSFEAGVGFFRDYFVAFELTVLPPDLNNTECRLWNPPFDRVEHIPNSIS